MFVIAQPLFWYQSRALCGCSCLIEIKHRRREIWVLCLKDCLMFSVLLKCWSVLNFSCSNLFWSSSYSLCCRVLFVVIQGKWRLFQFQCCILQSSSAEVEKGLLECAELIYPESWCHIISRIGMPYFFLSKKFRQVLSRKDGVKGVCYTTASSQIFCNNLCEARWKRIVAA